MLNEEIRRFIKAQPFEPFELELVTSRVLKVHHPDWLLIPPTPRAPYLVWVDRDGVAETINTSLVVAVRPQRPKPPRRKRAS
jgi:hypothetical protein